jgi:hypothetical protein
MDEYRELRNKLVSEGLKQPKPKPKRKPGKRPPDAKMTPALPELEKAEKPKSTKK